MEKADKVIGLVRRLAGCFRDKRDGWFIEHTVATLVGQRLFGIALGYDDLNDHDDLRHDSIGLTPTLGTLCSERR